MTLTSDQRQELDLASNEQLMIDHDISQLHRLCDRWGTAAVQDWVASIDIQKKQEEERQNREFLFWSNSNSFDLTADHF